MPASETIHVQGLRELNRAFKAADRTLSRELRVSLRAAVEPVRTTAEQLATEQIPRIGVPWSQMRIGVTTTSVYLAPKQRGTKFQSRRRPNLAKLLLERSMQPALEQNESLVVENVERTLATVGLAWEA